jgi:hypothetical protein
MKSVIAMVAGLAVFGAAIFAMEAVTGPVMDFTTRGQGLWLAWEAAGMIAAGYVTARLAPRSRPGHAIAVGALQALMNAGAMVVMRPDGGSPLWFWIVGIAVMIPTAWLGGTIGARSRLLT